MEVEINPPLPDVSPSSSCDPGTRVSIATPGELHTHSLLQVTKDSLIQSLVRNKNICFKSQQRGEFEPTDEEKTEIAGVIFENGKSNFLSRFGKYLIRQQLEYFRQFEDDPKEGYEINFLVASLSRFHSKNTRQLDVKNRRYQALRKLIKDGTYFSETEMMRRNPLLYDQLVGQYLSEDERKQRDNIDTTNITLVNLLMEGIERDQIKDKKKLQEYRETDAREENREGEEGVSEKPLTLRWGEFEQVEEIRPWKRKETPAPNHGMDNAITAEERRLLKEEFISSMYQSFLDGKDEEFDYDTVDNNDVYDDIEIITHDEEDKYFDSEDPEDTKMDDDAANESSEDELDIYMSALNHHPAICRLSEDLKKM